MINFCTLFNYNYIEKGLALYYSLYQNCPDFMLYIIAFDEKCYKTLCDLSLDKMMVIHYSEFEDDKLKLAKSNRSIREFLWTCSSCEIRYVINRFGLNNCTYIDSDVFFYSDPSIVIKRFLDSDKDVAIISHRYSNHLENRKYERLYGSYCVEFNTFKNTREGIEALEWWCEKCLELCPEEPKNGAFGDQKYLDQLVLNFKGIYVYNDFGLGIAPWNVDEYMLLEDNLIKNKHNNSIGKLVFYHFHALSMESNFADINIYKRPGKKDDSLIDFLYKGYLQKLKSLQIENNIVHQVNNDYRSNVFKRTIVYLFEENSLIIAIRKFIRLLLYRKKDIVCY